MFNSVSAGASLGRWLLCLADSCHPSHRQFATGFFYSNCVISQNSWCGPSEVHCLTLGQRFLYYIRHRRHTINEKRYKIYRREKLWQMESFSGDTFRLGLFNCEMVRYKRCTNFRWVFTVFIIGNTAIFVPIR